MKRVLSIAVAILIICSSVVAQNANYEQNTVIVKVNANKVDTFFKSAYVTSLRERFGDFGYKLEFPDAVRPVKEYDNYGHYLPTCV